MISSKSPNNESTLKQLFSSPEEDPYRKLWSSTRKRQQNFELPPIFRPETSLGHHLINVGSPESLGSSQ